MSASENEFFKNVAGQAMRDYAAPDDNKEAAQRLTWAILAILAFVGIEAVKVIFRKNFGINGLNMIRLVLCAVCFFGISAIAIFCMFEPQEDVIDFGSHSSFLATALFYIILAFYILVKGMRHRSNSLKAQGRDPEYKGDSTLLSFLQRDGWKESTIQNIAEPLLTITIGTFFCFFNWLWGVPIIFCGLSVWGYLLMEAMFFNRPLEGRQNQLQNRQNPESDFVKINH